MPVTLTSEDRTIAAQLLAVSPSDQIDEAVWRLGDALPNGDDIASTRLAVGPGFTGEADVTLVSPASSSGDSAVQLAYRYLDAAEAILNAGHTSTLAVTPVEADYSLSLPTAPAGTVACELALVSAMNPPGDPVRTNEFLDPRCTSASIWSARNSWTLSAPFGISGPLPGITNAARATCGSAGSANNSGLNMFCAVGESTPSGAGAPAIPGSTMTCSMYVYTTKAGTITLEVRPFAGSSWSAAATSTATAVPANTWTRISVTLTIPAGATQLAATIRQATTTWASGDYIQLTAILLEEASSLGRYFDGSVRDAAIPDPKSSRWEGTPHASRSMLYASTMAGGATVEATDSTLVYAATAHELVGAALERDYRRSVADIWNDAQPLITAGTAGLLAGQLTFLCDSLAQALALDAVYRMPGLITLTTGAELDGLTHRAVGAAQITNENVLPGKPPKWLLVTEFREQVN